MATKDVVDILLIGSGASGGPFAWYLSQVKGLRIVCSGTRGLGPSGGRRAGLDAHGAVYGRTWSAY